MEDEPASHRALKLAQHLENRPTVEALIEHNILKSFRADPSLHEVMQALIRTRREKELGALLKKRRSLQDLIDRNIMVGGPPGSPEVCKARQALLKHFRRNQLNTFLEKRPSISDVAKRHVLEDTLIWTRLGQNGVTPLARNGATLSCIDDALYLIGGFCAEGRHSTYDILCYNVASECWSRPICAGAFPSDRFAHSCSVVGKQLVLFGGCGPDGVWLNDVHVLDTEFEQALIPKLEAKHSWKNKLPPQTMLLWYAPETTGAQPCPRAAHSATVVGTQVYIFGGNDGTRLFNDVHILEIETMGWSKPKVRGTPPAPRAGHAAALVGDHELYIFGGGTAQGPSNTLHVLDLETLTWSEPAVSGTPPSPRVGHTMHAMMGPSPMLLVFAGGTLDKLFDDLHVFSCQTKQWSRPSDTGTVPVARTGHSSCIVRDHQSQREAMYFFGGAGPQGQLYNDLYTLDCAFISEASLEAMTPDEALKQDELSPSAASDGIQDGQRYDRVYADRVQTAKEKINDLMTAVKNKIDLAQADAVQKEKQLSGSIKRSFMELRAEVDAMTVFVGNELSNLLDPDHE